MDVFQQSYYKINEILMTCIGQWPYQSRLASRIFLFILVFLCTTQIVPQVMAVVKYRDDPDIVLESLPPFLIELVCITKLITCMAHSKKRLKLLNRTAEDWKTWAPDREIIVLHEYAETGRKMAFIYTGAIYSTGIIFLTQPIIPKIIDVCLYNGTERGEFPLPVYYYRLDQQKYYFYIILYTYLCVSMLIIITIAFDTMFIVYVQHICGIFAALGQKLKRIGEDDEPTDGKDLNYENLTVCIDRHNDAIEYAKLIEATYSGCFLFVVGFNMLVMSITGIQIFTKTSDPQETIRFIALVGAQMTHLFIESYISQILMDHSISIRDYILDGKWYKISLKSQKLVNVIIMRCNMPCKLTTGNISVMSLETFGMVVKTSLSYFTLLRSMQ